MQRPRNSIVILTIVVLGLMGTQIAGVTDLAAASGPTPPVTIHGADDETTRAGRKPRRGWSDGVRVIVSERIPPIWERGRPPARARLIVYDSAGQ